MDGDDGCGRDAARGNTAWGYGHDVAGGLRESGGDASDGARMRARAR